ncbi:MAG: ATP-grasp domain-containing protein [Fimbriimonadaceae bacterium]|nr:ATP-grasp domain-containing protein [Fimbriimonadaceae bacterium]
MADRFEIGVLGGGQLARMTMLAAHRLGVTIASYDPDPHGPAAQVGPTVVGALTDPDAMAAFLSRCDRAVLDSEFVPVCTIRAAMKQAGFPPNRLVPDDAFLAVIQDKLAQRQLYRVAGVPSPEARGLYGESAPPRAYPVVLKSRFGGYDGKGTRVIRTREDWDAAVEIRAAGDWLEEDFVPFRHEVAVMVARTPTETVAYRPVITVQPNLVCEYTVPYDGSSELIQRAQTVAIAAVEAIGAAVGLFGVELFLTATGEFVVNEIAPRPHNTGHATMDDAGTSQFEQLVRIATGLPLGPVVESPTVGMANLLGPGDGSADGASDPERLRAARASVGGVEPFARVHWYGKQQVRAGRKLGHINVPGIVSLANLPRLRAAADAFWRGYGTAASGASGS